MKIRKGFRKGFTLVEMMIVVAIIAILAGMAVPRFMTNIRKSEATEGVRLMKQIADAESAFFSSHGKYSESLKVLGIDLNTEGDFNEYTIKACGTNDETGVVIKAKNTATSNTKTDIYMFYPKSAVDLNGTITVDGATVNKTDVYEGTSYTYDYINQADGGAAPKQDCSGLGTAW